MSGKSFTVKEDFYCNGEKIKIISGGIHYFRVVPEYWRDRLEKLKAMGCNTVETYVPWNLHEAKEGEYNFEGILDISQFLLLAKEIGLYAIVRPSPFICAEWEFGGMPAWLLEKTGIRFRADNEAFLSCVRNYYQELFKQLTPLQINYDGPIILFQIENEYGYYGNDKKYLQKLKQNMEENGVVVPFVTSDGPSEQDQENGMLIDVLPTANFGSHGKERFEILRKVVKNRPLMCMEFWIGWFDSWGKESHATSNLEENVKEFDDMLSLGNVNIYMFHGGTNFGFMNGSNYYDRLEADVTSYDYDAVLTEDGRITPKYEAFQKVASKYIELPNVKFSANIIRKAYGELSCDKKVSLFSVIDEITKGIESPYPLNMEAIGQNYGYILYRSVLKRNKLECKLKLLGAADRALIFLDGELVATKYDKELEEEMTLSLKKEETQLSILVENMGRVNFGPNIEKQKKGIKDGVLVDGAFQCGWTHYSLPMESASQIPYEKEHKIASPAFYHFTLEADELGDTFVDMSKWGKGCVWINDFLLGRFWEVGPQKRLYIPAPLLKQGKNELVVFETEGNAMDSITLYDEPDLG